MLKKKKKKYSSFSVEADSRMSNQKLQVSVTSSKL